MLELTAALFVLSVGMMGTIQMYHVGVAKTGVIGEAAIALSAVENEIETLRAQPFAALTDGGDRPFVSATPMLDRLPEAEARVTIRAYNESMPGLKQVDARVLWLGENGRRVEKSLTTLIADRGAP
jgi:hypothetical protein